MAISMPASARDIDGVRPMHTMLCMNAITPSTTHAIANSRIAGGRSMRARNMRGGMNDIFLLRDAYF